MVIGMILILNTLFFHFSDNPDGLNVEKITKDNIYSSMNDLMGDFNGLVLTYKNLTYYFLNLMPSISII